MSGITSLSMFSLMRPENLLLAGLAKSLLLKKYFLYALVLLPMRHVNFRKMQIVFYVEGRSSYKIKLESLRYYDTFKVGKFAWLFYKLIHACKILIKYIQFRPWLLRFLFYVISRSSNFF